MVEILKSVSAVITLGRDAAEPTQFLDANTKEWVSVANKTEFKKANLKWNVATALNHIEANKEEFKTLEAFELSIDYKLRK